MYQLKQIEKNFLGVRALKSVDFHINQGEIVGLVGENGAGKSTLMKILYGAYQPDGGQMFINDEAVRLNNPRQALDKGIGMVFQEQSLITNLSVMENIFLGYEKQFSRFGVIDWKSMERAARLQLQKVKLDIDSTAITNTLSFAQRQMVELAKVLTLEEHVDGQLVILLDEPTSVLSGAEIEILFSVVRELRSRASFIFVSHRLDEVLELSDRIYVLKDGEVVDVVVADDANIEAIQRKMVGRDVDKEYYREQRQKPYQQQSVLVEFKQCSMQGKYSNIDFTLHAGEVLCLIGTEGAGCEEVLRTIFGLEKPDSGSVMLGTKQVTDFHPVNSIANNIGYLPRERKIEGIIGDMSVYENMTLSQLSRYSRFGVLNIADERSLAQEWIKKLSIKVSSEQADCSTLSGGNQQKVVLAKWRSSGSIVMLLDHPTRGLDIGAKEDVYDLVRDMCNQGLGVILVADTLEEAIGLSHTIIVMKDGQEQKRYDCQPGNKPEPFDLLHYML